MRSRISSRIQRIKPSPSVAAADRAAELRREGRDIINLAVGEPDFDTPLHIRQAACEAIARGETRYTANVGTPALRQAIVDKLQRENDLYYTPNDIIVTCGAKHAFFNALAVTMEANDEVVIPAPFWVSYPDMVLACDGLPVIVPCDEDSGFKLSPAALEKAITPRTRWLVLNSPVNPTGAVYSEAEMRALAGVLLFHPQVMLMTDDIYEHIRFDDVQFRHIVAVEPRLKSNTLVINGVSKSYAMTGWRIGYAAGPQDVIRAMDTLQSQSTSNACSISQAAAVAALRGDQGFVASSNEVYRARRDLGLKLLNDIPGMQCRSPGGAFYLYVKCSGLIGRRTEKGRILETDSDFVLYLLDEVGVATVAGSSYGLSPYFRMSIATDLAIIREGCVRIARAVKSLM